MTDPIVDFSDVPEPETGEVARRRGRPRSQETIQRDAEVLKALQDGGPQTKEQLVEAMRLKPSLVYLALWRLKRTGQVERTSDGANRYVWQAAS